MKRNLLFAISMLMMVFASAQDIMKVQLTNGSVVEYNVADVERVFFDKKVQDLWPDYRTTFGLTFSELKAVYGAPYSVSGNSVFYTIQDNDYASMVVFELDPFTQKCTSYNIMIKSETVDKNLIVNYLSSKYNLIYEEDNHYRFIDGTDLDNYTFKVLYSGASLVSYRDKTYGMTLWPDYTTLFGGTKNAVQQAMADYGHSFLMSNTSYSLDGADLYYVSGNSHIMQLYFVYNPDAVVSEIWVYYNSSTNAENEIYLSLDAKYIENEEEKETGKFVYYNADKTIRVVMDMWSKAIIYTDLTQKPFTRNQNPFGENYWEALGKTQNEIQTLYGEPYMINSYGIMIYFISSQCSSICRFRMSEAGLCNLVNLSIDEGVEVGLITDFFNKNFTIYEPGTPEDGSRYTWLNGSTIAESTMGIVYSVGDKIVQIQQLNTSSAKLRFSKEPISDFQ